MFYTLKRYRSLSYCFIKFRFGTRLIDRLDSTLRDSVSETFSSTLSRPIYSNELILAPLCSSKNGCSGALIYWRRWQSSRLPKLRPKLSSIHSCRSFSWELRVSLLRDSAKPTTDCLCCPIDFLTFLNTVYDMLLILPGVAGVTGVSGSCDYSCTQKIFTCFYGLGENSRVGTF